jgi:hypothetical protein
MMMHPFRRLVRVHHYTLVHLLEPARTALDSNDRCSIKRSEFIKLISIFLFIIFIIAFLIFPQKRIKRSVVILAKHKNV